MAQRMTLSAEGVVISAMDCLQGNSRATWLEAQITLQADVGLQNLQSGAVPRS